MGQLVKHVTHCVVSDIRRRSDNAGHENTDQAYNIKSSLYFLNSRRRLTHPIAPRKPCVWNTPFTCNYVPLAIPACLPLHHHSQIWSVPGTSQQLRMPVGYALRVGDVLIDFVPVGNLVVRHSFGASLPDIAATDHVVRHHSVCLCTSLILRGSETETESASQERRRHWNGLTSSC